MAIKRIKTGDEVIVISGKDKGRRGSVQRVDGDKVLVDGINVIKKHVKPNPQRGTQGGIVQEERPVHISNVMHFNGQSQKADRVGIKTLEDGKRVRFYKGTGEVVDV